jgi:hypothetical protein
MKCNFCGECTECASRMMRIRNFVYAGKTLCVKCPSCGHPNDLGKERLIQYDSPAPFVFEHECAVCGRVFDMRDTHEADYSVIDMRR